MTSQTYAEDLALRCFGMSSHPQFLPRLPTLPIRVTLCFGPVPHINLAEVRLPTDLMPGTTGTAEIADDLRFYRGMCCSQRYVFCWNVPTLNTSRSRGFKEAS